MDTVQFIPVNMIHIRRWNRIDRVYNNNAHDTEQLVTAVSYGCLAVVLQRIDKAARFVVALRETAVAEQSLARCVCSCVCVSPTPKTSSWKCQVRTSNQTHTPLCRTVPSLPLNHSQKKGNVTPGSGQLISSLNPLSLSLCPSPSFRLSFWRLLLGRESIPLHFYILSLYLSISLSVNTRITGKHRGYANKQCVQGESESPLAHSLL